MVTNLSLNSFDNQPFVHFVRISYGDLGNKGINVKVRGLDFLLRIYSKNFNRLACLTAVHKRCHEKLLGQCSGSSSNTESTNVS